MDKMLIEQVVREVIARMQDLGAGVVSQKPCLLLVHGEHRSQAEVEEMAATLSSSWHVRTSSFGTPDLIAVANGISRAVLFDTQQDLLVRGALGFTDSPLAELLAHLLHNGTPVTLIPVPALTWILHSAHADDKLPEPAKRYRQVLRQNRDTLVSFGAKFAGNLNELDVDYEKTLYFDDKLLTHYKVQSTHVNTIVVSLSTLITPLARDTAKEKGITILFKKS